MRGSCRLSCTVIFLVLLVNSVSAISTENAAQKNDLAILSESKSTLWETAELIAAPGEELSALSDQSASSSSSSLPSSASASASSASSSSSIGAPPAPITSGGKSEISRTAASHPKDSKIHRNGISAVGHHDHNTHIYLVNNNQLSQPKPTVNFGEEFHKKSEESHKKFATTIDRRRNEEVAKDKQEQVEKDAAVKKEETQKSEFAQKMKAEQEVKSNPCVKPENKLVPNPTSVVLKVSAKFNSIQGAGYPLDTGIYVKKNSAISVVGTGLWYAAKGGAASDAGGYRNLPIYNYNGLQAYYGSLVGRIGDGPFFTVGVDYYSCKINQEGRLFLAYWDSDSENNDGDVEVKIQYQHVEEQMTPCFQKQIPNGASKTVTVQAKDNSVSESGRPLDTNAWLSANTPVHITATGEWYSAPGNDLISRPDGITTTWNSVRFFSLVGRAGLSDWFFVGSNFHACQFSYDGPLQLAYWDSDSNSNRGSVTAVIHYVQNNEQKENDCVNKVAHGATTTINVLARENSANGGSPADSGVDVVQGKSLKITSQGTWYAAFGNQLQSDPNGWSQTYQSQGLTARFFSLVGRIGNGPLFFVGSDYFNCFARQSGRLTFVYWDGNSFDNSGSVKVSITH